MKPDEVDTVHLRLAVFDKVLHNFGDRAAEWSAQELIDYCDPISIWMATGQARKFGGAL